MDIEEEQGTFDTEHLINFVEQENMQRVALQSLQEERNRRYTKQIRHMVSNRALDEN